MPKHRGVGFGAGLGALGVGAIATAVGGAYKFSEAAIRLKKLHDVASENEVFVRLVERVRIDLEETERLLHHPAIKRSLSTNPEKVHWIRGTIHSTHEALQEIGKYTVRVSSDTDRGKHVGLRHRIRWVLDEHEKLYHRRMELATCHQSLVQVLGFLASLEPLACCRPGQEADADVRFSETINVNAGDGYRDYQGSWKTVGDSFAVEDGQGYRNYRGRWKSAPEEERNYTEVHRERRVYDDEPRQQKELYRETREYDDDHGQRAQIYRERREYEEEPARAQVYREQREYEEEPARAQVYRERREYDELPQRRSEQVYHERREYVNEDESPHRRHRGGSRL